MNLKKKILDEWHSDLDGDVCRHYNTSDILDAMEEYAEKMCKKQRKRIAKNIKKQYAKYLEMSFDEFLETDTPHSWEIALNTPLVTEE